MNRTLCFLLLLLATWLPCLAQAKVPAVLLDAKVQQLDLVPSLYVLEDPDASLSIDAVRQRFANGGFQPNGAASFNKGYTRSAWWLAFEFRQAPDASAKKLSWLVEIAYPSLDAIALYLPGSSAAQLMGDRLPFSQRLLPHVNFVFPLPDSGADVSTVFLRVRNEGTLMVPLTLWSADAFAQASRLNYAGQAAYFGALLAMMIYNALLWLSLRERVYLEYVLYAAFLSIGLGAVNGMSAQFFWPEIPWLIHYSYLLGFALAGVFVTRFARSFLDTRATSRWLD